MHAEFVVNVEVTLMQKKNVRHFEIAEYKILSFHAFACDVESKCCFSFAYIFVYVNDVERRQRKGKNIFTYNMMVAYHKGAELMEQNEENYKSDNFLLFNFILNQTDQEYPKRFLNCTVTLIVIEKNNN